MELPLVSVVIPTHNRKEKLVRLIMSILESSYPKDRIEIIVIDDASTDGTYEYIRKLFPNVKIIHNEKEKLLAESRNIGIRASKGKYIFVIDDDNVVDKNTIMELVKFMEEHPDVGVAGPIMYFLKDPNKIWCAGVRRNYWITITRFIGFNARDDGYLKRPFESEDLPNALMIRREVINKIGLFNSKLFPIHYDEADFCQRVRNAGYKVVIVPSARIWHDIPPPKHNIGELIHLKNEIRAYFCIRNRIIFHFLYSKNALQIFTSLISTSLLMLLYILGISFSKTNRRLIIRALIKGYINGLKLIRILKSFRQRYLRATIRK